MKRSTEILLSCEHGGNRVPAHWRHLFRRGRAALASHRGFDPGALLLARTLAGALEAELVAATTTRLLIDFNRSTRHPRLHSEFTRCCSEVERAHLRRLYDGYRKRVLDRIESARRRGKRVLHLSVHSFTPVLDGIERNADIGLLYDPARRHESGFCLRLQQELKARDPALRVRRNYPYRGAADGFTTFLRGRFPPGNYSGVEFELNQIHAACPAGDWSQLRRHIRDAVVAAVEDG